MKKRQSLIHILCALLSLASGVTGYSRGALSTLPQTPESGIETEYLSSTIRPQDDFYEYVTYEWAAQKPRDAYGRVKEKISETSTDLYNCNSYSEMDLNRFKLQRELISIIRNASQTAPSQAERMIATYRKSYEDERKLEELGLSPIKEEMNEILSAKNYSKLVEIMTHPDNADLIIPDHGRVIWRSELGYVTRREGPVAFMASGLMLEEPFHYLEDKEPGSKYRQTYLEYIEDIFKKITEDSSVSIRIDNPKEKAKAVLAFETKLATCYPNEDEEEGVTTYSKPMTISELQQFAPGFDWNTFITNYNLKDQETFILEDPEVIQKITKCFIDTDLETLKYYMLTHLVHENSDYLSYQKWELPSENFENAAGKNDGWFKIKKLSGIRSIDDTFQGLHELVIQVYLEKHPEIVEAKSLVEAYTNSIQVILKSHLQNAQWLNAETRAKYLTVLNGMQFRIGFADQFHDYSSLDFREDDPVGNSKQIMRLWYNQMTEDAKASAPSLTRDTFTSMMFYLSKESEHAHYISWLNASELFIESLQFPFISVNADPAANFGALGSVIGHEMTHAFAHTEEFQKQAEKLVEQFNGYILRGEDETPYGVQTQKENICDLIGLDMAYQAYQNYVQEYQNGQAPIIDELTGDQRFFIAYAQTWRTIYANEETRKEYIADCHALAEFRVNGIVRNIDVWYEAFNVQEGDALYLPPEERVRIWQQ